MVIWLFIAKFFYRNGIFLCFLEGRGKKSKQNDTAVFSPNSLLRYGVLLFSIEFFHFKKSGAFKITANIFAHPVYCCYNTCTLKSSLLGEKKKRLSPVRRTYIHTQTFVK